MNAHPRAIKFTLEKMGFARKVISVAGYTLVSENETFLAPKSRRLAGLAAEQLMNASEC